MPPPQRLLASHRFCLLGSYLPPSGSRGCGTPAPGSAGHTQPLAGPHQLPSTQNNYRPQQRAGLRLLQPGYVRAPCLRSSWSVSGATSASGRLAHNGISLSQAAGKAGGAARCGSFVPASLPVPAPWPTPLLLRLVPSASHLQVPGAGCLLGPQTLEPTTLGSNRRTAAPLRPDSLPHLVPRRFNGV